MGKTKNASCSELGDGRASDSELGDLEPWGAIVVYVLGAMAPGPFGDSRESMWLLGLSASLDATPGSERDRINLFPTTSE